jgi:hypothetical protein
LDSISCRRAQENVETQMSETSRKGGGTRGGGEAVREKKREAEANTGKPGQGTEPL